MNDLAHSARPKTLAEQWQVDLLNRPSIEETVALLSSCLALVRPVGMIDRMAEEWLTVAAQEVSYIPVDILRNACADARRTCHHHGRIVPAVIAYADPIIEQRSKAVAAERASRQPDRRDAIKHDPWIPTREELDELARRAAADLAAERGTTPPPPPWPD